MLVFAATVCDTVSTTVLSAGFQNAEENLLVRIDSVKRLEILAKPKPGSVRSKVSFTSTCIPSVNDKTREIASVPIEALVVEDVNMVDVVREEVLNVPTTPEKTGELLRTIDVVLKSMVFEKQKLLEFFLVTAVVDAGVRVDLDIGALEIEVVATDWTEYLSKESTGETPKKPTGSKDGRYANSTLPATAMQLTLKILLFREIPLLGKVMPALDGMTTRIGWRAGTKSISPI